MSRLERRTPLARGRARLARVGRRGARRREGLEAFRAGLLERARGRCERCTAPTPEKYLEAHHVLPRSRGGTDDLSNGAALCRSCHQAVHAHRVDDWRDWLRTRGAA